MRSVLTTYLLSSVLCMAAGAATEAAAPVEPKRLSAPAKELLLKIAAADQTTGLVIDDSTAEAKTLAKAGWLYVDGTKRSGTNVPAILSPTGKVKADSYATKTPANPRGPAPSPDDFEIETGLEIPDFSVNRRAPRQIYPFDKMTSAGMSFFIKQPEGFEGKDFAQTKAGTVSSQNRKLKEAYDAAPVEGRPEKPVAFKVVNDTKDGVAGARVWRIS